MKLPRIGGSKNPAELAMVQVQRLRDQLAGLRTSLANAEADVERANRARRELLIAERQPTAAEIKKADADCLAAGNSVAGWADACSVVAGQLAEAEAVYSRHVTEAKQAEVVADAERRAAAIDAAAQAFAEAAEQFNVQRLAFVDAVRENGMPVSAAIGWPTTPYLLAEKVTAAALRTATGVILEPAFFGHIPEPSDPLLASRRACSAPLLDLVDELKAGNAPSAELAPHFGAAPVQVKVQVQSERVILSRGISFEAGDNGIGYGMAGGADLPPAVAAAARAAGVGFAPGSKDGLQILEALQRLPMNVVLKQNPSGVWVRDPGKPEGKRGKSVGPEEWLWIDLPGDQAAAA